MFKYKIRITITLFSSLNQFSSWHHSSLRYFLILFSPLSLGIASVLFSSAVPTKILYKLHLVQEEITKSTYSRMGLEFSTFIKKKNRKNDNGRFL